MLEDRNDLIPEELPLVHRLAEQLRSLKTDVPAAAELAGPSEMLERDLQRRHQAANRRDTAAWGQVKSRDDWERFLAPRLEALQASLGRFPAPAKLRTWRTRAFEGDGFHVENIVFESRPDVIVSANLYLPSQRRDRMPAILIVHSHHNPKIQGELQDMGMTWARQGCAVLIMDQLGHGERGQHRPGPRQDYRFRSITGIQLHLIGDSLIGWMVWDIQRGIDLILAQPGIDSEKLILIGAVAGGGDPAAVAAALDARIGCVIPFNFGGPQPETPYPLPDDAEESFDYLGRGSWESTRNLRLSGRDGFLPWVIVAAVAPRRLVYAHEFSWDRERDPVWRRLQQVFAFYDASENLAYAHGDGVLSGQPPEATHCNQVGAVHRRMLYPAPQRWFGIPEPEQEYQQRLPEEMLACMPDRAGETVETGGPSPPTPRPLHHLWSEIGASRALAMRQSLEPLTPDARRERLRQAWAPLLGDVEPATEPVVEAGSHRELSDRIVRIEQLRLQVEPGIILPLLLAGPTGRPRQRRAVVVAVSQHGKDRFLRERGGEIASVIAGGVLVCLPDLRGLGEQAPPGSREARGDATALAATEWMLGQTLLGSGLRDLRSVLRYLRTRPDLDPARIALWGDSFAPVNPPGFPDPLLGEEETPAHSEPLGGLLALFGALFEEGIAGVAARRTLAGYLSVLANAYCYIPHNVIVPGALTAGDLCDVAAALVPCPLRLEDLVDGRNCPVSEADARRCFEPAIHAYRAVEGNLLIRPGPAQELVPWLLVHLAHRAPRKEPL